MACACKVNQRINEINKTYGISNRKTIKTNIVGNVRLFIKQCLIYLLCLPLIPFMVLFTGFRHFFTKKPLSIKKIFNIISKYVRNK